MTHLIQKFILDKNCTYELKLLGVGVTLERGRQRGVPP